LFFGKSAEEIERMGDNELLSAKEGKWKKTKSRKFAIFAKLQLSAEL
jgi:hypothetical protein